MQLTDAGQRKQALDPSRSFIVQAPAGSGKTELLVQRYLSLLSQVDRPEEILAITFTRKAASEMRNRVIQAIDRARSSDREPESDPERTAWRLAREVAEQDRRRQWSLPDSPSRLRIQTIDALSASLTRQMPLLSGFGSQPDILEDAEALYRTAAERTMEELESEAGWSDSLEVLLEHLDNDMGKVSELLSEMLGRRDQWLRYLADPGSERLVRSALEQGLQRLITDRLNELRESFSEETAGMVLSLARFAASNLEADSGSCLLACTELDQLPGTAPESLSIWHGLCELLLTQSGEYRKRVNKNQGFPPPASARTPEEKANYQERKEAYAACIEALRPNERLREALLRARRLPAAIYSERQWRVLRALLEVLRLAVAHLNLEFSSRGAVDFIEVSLRALQALGRPQDPSDLALILDYRLQHILVDEFQDTSLSQFALLERLTEGWQPEDGRSFFAVGDPMQSIYRFREAEVGLFLRARRRGLGHLALQPLVLQANFRSRAGLVEQMNAIGPEVFPAGEDETAGAVPFSPSQARRAQASEVSLSIHPFYQRDDQAEAQAVVEIVSQQRRRDPEGSIAVLVRSRSHLAEIVPALRSAGLPFQAVDIEPLSRRPIIQDLVSLTKALSHRADRLSWLAVLRAPWCGLTLNDLHALSQAASGSDIPSSLGSQEGLSAMSRDGSQRVRRIAPILEQGLAEIQRHPLSRLVEGVWLALGGPACAEGEKDLQDARTYFSLLERSAGRVGITSFGQFEREISRLFAASESQADPQLQIMTIHKAKGLEFDTVILPGLGRQPQAERKPLLLWQERAAHDGSRDLLLAPIAETGRSDDSIYRYIRDLNAEKQRNETIRLAYVAMTRARERLHLLGHTTVHRNSGQLSRPSPGSLLGHLWPAMEPIYRRELERTGVGQPDRAGGPEASADSARLRRLATTWSLPQPPQPLAWVGGESASEGQHGQEALVFDWAGEVVRQVGTIVHLYLQEICRTGLRAWEGDRLARERPRIRELLLRAGLEGSVLEQAADQVMDALGKSLSDPRGRWILTDHHLARSELALSGIVNARLINVVMDRTFIDEKGLRWIIDFKAGMHSGGDPEAFLDRELERYRPQLETYAALLSRHEARAIRLGLYFPRLQGWREWGWQKHAHGPHGDQP